MTPQRIAGLTKADEEISEKKGIPKRDSKKEYPGHLSLLL